MAQSTTDPLPREERRDESGGRRYVLFEILRRDRLLDACQRWSLGTLDEIRVGRGNGGPAKIGTRLGWRIADRFLSTAHCRFLREGEAWVLEDEGSKNGTFVNGARVAKHPMRDGDLIEVGATFLSFRSTRVSVEPAIAAHDGLRTMLPELQRSFEEVAQLAGSSVSMLMVGETGVGKEVLARAIHDLSKRRGAFVAVNCSAIPPALIESQFFGHRRGAFSGAVENSLGWVRSADRGTLFLDEIGDLPLPAQGALLRVLQELEVVPVGEHRPVPVDVRVCGATHADLGALVAQGRFRSDLLMRLQGYTLQLPPLRQRREDLGLILGALLRRLNYSGAEVVISSAAVSALLAHDWPGNIRELEKCVQTALVLAAGEEIQPKHLRLSTAARPQGENGDLRERISALLEAHQGNVTAVAREMGKARFQVQRWIRKLQLKPDSYRKQ